MSGELIWKFMEQAKAFFDEEDAELLGLNSEKRNQRLDEDVRLSRVGVAPPSGEFLRTIHGKESDSELVLVFESPEDAMNLYSFIVDNGLLEAGEVMYRDIEGQYSVAFMSHVPVQRPEIIQAALMAYEDQMEPMEDGDEMDAFEDLIADLSDRIDETNNTVSGAPKRKKGMGNPFHDKKDGKFSGVADHAAKKGGSWSIGKTKLKFAKAGKGSKGGILGKYAATKLPCGRAARKKGKNVRCWDGSSGGDEAFVPAGARLAEAIRSRADGTKMSMATIALVMGLKDKYGRK